ncbi:MAG: hypothetical protein PVI90_01120, partial [Desulfobacteraceae bacterium]
EGSYDEIWLRVADLDDLAKYTEQSLTRITAKIPGEFAGVGASPSDKLIITTSIPEWLDTYVTDQVFTVEYVDSAGDYLLIYDTKPFPTARNSLAWSLKDSTQSVLRSVGINAMTHRRDPSTTPPFLRRHWTHLFSTVTKASGRVISNEAFVQALVNAANTHGIVFEGIDTETFSE